MAAEFLSSSPPLLPSEQLQSAHRPLAAFWLDESAPCAYQDVGRGNNTKLTKLTAGFVQPLLSVGPAVRRYQTLWLVGFFHVKCCRTLGHFTVLVHTR